MKGATGGGIKSEGELESYSRIRSTLAFRSFKFVEEYSDPTVDLCSLEGWFIESDEEDVGSFGGSWDVVVFDGIWGLKKIMHEANGF